MENSVIEESKYNDDTNLTENRLQINHESNADHGKAYPTLIDKIIGEYGYGSELWKIIICISLLYIVNGYSGTIFATMIKPYTQYLNLSDEEIGTIGFVYFLLKAFAALFTGFFTNLLNGRLILLHLCLFTILLSNLLLGLILTKPVLYGERIFSGIASGILEPIVNNIFCEYLPIKLRGFTMVSVWIGFNIGQLFPDLIMIGTMPHYETNGISKTLLYSCLPLLLCIVISLIFLKDSARNYILHGKEEKGLKILEKISLTGKLSPDDKLKLLKEVKEGVNKDISISNSLDLIKNKFLLLSIYVSIIAFISNFVSDGPNLIMNLTLTDIQGNSSQDNVLRNSIIVILIAIPSSLIGAISFEIKFLGRRKTMFLSFLFLIIAMVLTILFTKYIYIFLGIYQAISNYGSVLVGVYTSEVFPSIVRDFTSGLNTFFCYVGSASSQFAFIELRKVSPFFPYYGCIFVCVVGCIITCLLTIETYQRPLDLDDDNQNENDYSTRQNNHILLEDESSSLINK